MWIVEAGEGGTGTVRRRGVDIGDITGEGIEIIQGLDDGEHVVTAGVSRIIDGQQVQFTEDQETSS